MRRLRAFVASASLIATLAGVGACSRAPEARQYEVRGQILSLDTGRREVLVDHEDIPGFMPAMTMPYRVSDVALLEGKQPGDLITATLVVEEVDAYLSSMTTTGHAPIKNPGAGPAITDADLLKPGDAVPDAALIDEQGAARPLSSLRGHRAAITFIYTRCPLPDFCPLMDRHFARIQEAIRTSPDLADVRLVSITLDPEFDTPPVLQKHAQAVGAAPGTWTFLTGSRGELLALAKRFGVTTEPGESDAVVVHNLRTAVIDAEGRVVSVTSGNMWTPAELVADLKKTPAPGR
jgi:protein SCO1/2